MDSTVRVDYNSGFIYFSPDKAGPILGEQMAHLETLTVEVKKDGVARSVLRGA